MRPSSKHCISIVALSVSMSATTDPDFTESPSLTFHLMTVPASIVSDRRGMVISMGIAWESQKRLFEIISTDSGDYFA